MTSSHLQKVGDNDTAYSLNSHLTWPNEQQKVGNITILPVQQLIIQNRKPVAPPFFNYASYLIP